MNSTTASLANSDGCTPMPPTPNQRRLPLISGAMISTSASAATTVATADQMTNGCR